MLRERERAEDAARSLIGLLQIGTAKTDLVAELICVLDFLILIEASRQAICRIGRL